MMRRFKHLFSQFLGSTSDQNFLRFIHLIENLVSKVLAIGMIVVILFAVIDLGRFLINDLQASNGAPLLKHLIEIFGLFLNILIALEILENIAAYLRKHAIQLELVIITALTAVARKIIIYDSKEAGGDYTGLAFAILSLSISYWIVRHVNRNQPEE
ncbi:phosphate-starvation-inducible PsiE family protein [Tumidithrix helvetica PCC 7403]